MKIAYSHKRDLNEAYNLRSDLFILSDEELRQLQNCLVEMLSDLSVVCEEHDLHLILVGGSLLGKVRHNGFIPWDDDLDVGLSRKEYDKLRRIFNQTKLSDKYILCGPKCEDGVSCRFLKVYKKNSILEGIEDSPNIPKKVFVDIFPIDDIPKAIVTQRAKGFFATVLMVIISCKETAVDHGQVPCSNASKKFKIDYAIRRLISACTSFWNLPKCYNMLDDMIAEPVTGDCATIAVGRKHYFGEIVPRNVFFPAKATDYCGVKVWVPHNEDLYLRNLYGDYMKVPPVEKREHHFFKRMVLDTTK